MLRSSPSHGPGSFVVSEPRPQTFPTRSATSCEISSGRPAVHRPVAGGVDDQVGRQVRCRPSAPRNPRSDSLDLTPLCSLILPVSDQVRGAHIDVVARPRRRYFMNSPEPSSPKSSRTPPPRAAHRTPHHAPGICVIDRDLELVHDPIRNGGEEQVGHLGRDARRDRLLGVQSAQADLHQRVRPRRCASRSAASSSRPPRLLERATDVVGRVVRADHDALACRHTRPVPDAQRMLLLAAEPVLPRECRHGSGCPTCRSPAPVASAATSASPRRARRSPSTRPRSRHSGAWWQTVLVQ